MLRPIILAMTLVVLAGQSAFAVDLKDCSKGTNRTRIACLQSNIVLLNSSYQTVAAELRKEVADLTQQTTALQAKVTDLETKVAGIQIPPPPDLSGYIKNNQKVRLRNSGWGNVCLDDDTKDAGHIQGWGCNETEAQRYFIEGR